MRILFAILIGFFSAIMHISAQQVFGLWNFEDTALINLYNPTFGNGSSQLTGIMLNANRNAGTTTGCQLANGTGALGITSVNPGNTPDSSGIIFLINTSNFRDITLTWDHRFSGTSTRTTRVQYTLNGADWLNFEANNLNSTIFCNSTLNDGTFDIGTVYGDTAVDFWSRKRVNFSSLSGVNDNPDFGVRIVASHFGNSGQFRQARDSSAVATSGTWRFDNITFEGKLINAIEINSENSEFFAPNPVSGLVFFKEPCTFLIYDVFGRMIDKKVKVDFYDFSLHSSGHYFIQHAENQTMYRIVVN
jgi:hypothetical protein